MPRIADYLIAADNKFEISRVSDGGFNHVLNFELDAGVHLASRSVLMFVILVLDGTKNLKFEVKVNGSQQLDYTLTATPTRVHTIHEVINANVLKHGNNTLDFHPMAGVGKLEFGDVVLFYQRDI
ncbi:MAG TPA: hypothetical protein VFX96_18795 [Pyrinomonadaceae bacterium]|nr:hypothetical protein [Pyrinomonadaceae bacterium]